MWQTLDVGERKSCIKYIYKIFTYKTIGKLKYSTVLDSNSELNLLINDTNSIVLLI